MLEYLKIQNLQSHKDSYLEFHPGSNCIIGENNSGKTTIMRALIALAFNHKGYYSNLKRFRKHSPTIEAGWLGHRITRNKEGYKLNGEQSVGDKVPLEIAHILNLHDINFKTIREELFLISLSPGARARLINQATGLASQEVLTAFCKVNIRECTNQIKIKEHLRTSLIADISRLSPIEELEEDFKDVEKMIARIAEIEDSFNDISNIVEEVEGLSDTLSIEKDLLSLKAKMESISELEDEALEISQKIADISFALVEIDKSKGTLEKEVTITMAKEELSSAEKLLAACEEMSTAMEELRQTVEDYAVSNTIEGTKEYEVEVNRRMVQDTLEEMGICPYCKSDLRKEK